MIRLAFFSILVHYLTMCAVARGQGDSSRLRNKMAYFLALVRLLLLQSAGVPDAALPFAFRVLCEGKEQMALCQSSTFSFVLLLIGTPNFHAKQ